MGAPRKKRCKALVLHLFLFVIKKKYLSMEKNKDRLWNKEYIKVMTANFSLFFAFYLLTPLLPIYLSEHFHASKDIIGLVLSGYVVTALFFRPFSGYVVDTFNRKKVLILCFFIYSIFFFYKHSSLFIIY